MAKHFKDSAAKSVDSNALTAISRFTRYLWSSPFFNSTNKFASEMRRLYKNRIPPDAQWVPLSIGGLQLRSEFLFASPFEYVAILAAPGKPC